MKYEHYIAYINATADYNSGDEMMMEYGYPADCPYSAENLQRIFDIIFAVSRNSFTELSELSGMNFRRFYIKYNIPERTAFSWKKGERTAPPYVMQLIGFAMISEIKKGDENEF